MTKGPPKDLGASVRSRLLRVARAQREDFQTVLTRYANERLLFRLAASKHAQHFVLKGAALFTLWTGKPHRVTRDLDLLGFGDPSVDHVREVFTEASVQASVFPRLLRQGRGGREVFVSARSAGSGRLRTSASEDRSSLSASSTVRSTVCGGGESLFRMLSARLCHGHLQPLHGVV
jgi:predicted nucleotidyltransferase component of viral defense system